MNIISDRSPSAARGFSLVELMVAVAVLGLAVASATVCMTQALNIVAYDNGRLLINHNNRKFANQLVTDAVKASYFAIYPNFKLRSKTVSGVTTDAAVATGDSGDLFVLVYQEPAPSDTTLVGNVVVHRVVGYFRDYPQMNADTDPTHHLDTPSGVGPVRRFEITIPDPGVVVGGSPAYTLYNLLNDYAPVSGQSSWPVVTESAQGSAMDQTTAARDRLFFNFLDQSAIVAGQFQEQGNTLKKFVTNTYNFAVSPRG